ncbi:MAG TPA: phosphate acyltransferase, partial [Burkholderiaceae bacterium]|nr:phosphate acyltransferase [Burkholderiaceae bacterium]
MPGPAASGLARTLTAVGSIRSLAELLAAIEPSGPALRVACAAANDESLLLSLRAALASGLIHPVLIGPRDLVRGMAASAGLDIDRVDIIHADSDAAACEQAMALCRTGQAQAIMKGAVPTSVLLKAALRADSGVRGQQSLTHVTAFRPKGMRRLLLLADAGVQIAPDADALEQIVRHTVRLAGLLGIRRPRVAMLSAAEFINPKMPSSVLADLVVRRFAQSGDLDAVVGGPYALDVAVSPEAARRKGVRDEIAGRADVLITPGIDAGNILYKSLTCFAGLDLASVIVGAAVPLIIPSRADTERTKLYSIALALLAGRAEVERAVAASTEVR